jgi:hypothetical protein
MDLAALAHKYIWWQPAESALRDRRRLIAQVMDIGTHADVESLRTTLGDDALKTALREARAGEFSERSWHYWHLVLGMAQPHAIPPMPTRKLP